MSKIIRSNIALVTDPQAISLVGNSNFIEISKTNTAGSTEVPTVIDIHFHRHSNKNERISFTCADSANPLDDTYILSSYREQMDEKEKKDSYLFWLGAKHICAENLKKCLSTIPYFRRNFHITTTLDYSTDASKPATVHLKSKPNSRIQMTVTVSDPSSTLTSMQSVQGKGNVDSLLDASNKKDIAIELELYTAVDGASNPTMTLSKVYNGTPVWFDLNKIWSNQTLHSSAALTKYSWSNAGSYLSYNVHIKRSWEGVTETFYQSDALHAITGYSRTLDTNYLASYVYSASKEIGAEPLIKPLSTQLDAYPSIGHTYGQCQFFNFILDPSASTKNRRIALQYSLLNQSGQLIKRITDSATTIALADLHLVNTIRLNIDQFLLTTGQRSNVGKVEVCIVSIDDAGRAISSALSFHILPLWINKVHDFAFLNSLGGWSSFNFAGKEQLDFTASTETIYKTHIPSMGIGSKLESVFTKQVTEQFVVESMPLQRDVAEWLRELSASVAVYELHSTRYVIVDELQIKTNSKDDLFTVEMKYHYTDSFNGGLRGR